MTVTQGPSRGPSATLHREPQTSTGQHRACTKPAAAGPGAEGGVAGMAESESESPALPLRLWQYPTAAIDPRQMISSGASAQEKLGQKGQWPLA